MPTLITQLLNKYTQHTAAILAFAETDSEFSNYLNQLFEDLANRDHSFTNENIIVGQYLIPADAEAARARAIWLKNELILASPEQTAEAKLMLSSHVSVSNQPKALLFGIVGLAIIGPTLGLIKQKKKTKSQMRIVLNTQEINQPAQNITKLSHQASVSLLGTELTKVYGDANRLDPELAEWLFVEQNTALFQADQNELQDIEKSLQQENLPYFSIHENDTIKAIAVSPCVNDSFETGEAIE